MRKLSLLLFFSFLLACLFGLRFVKAAPNCDDPSSITSNDDRDYCVAEIERLKNLYLPAQEINKKNLAQLQGQLSTLNKKIQIMLDQLRTFADDIAKREEDLAYIQQIFDEKTASHYKFLRLYDPIMPFLSSSDAAEAFREIIFRERAADEDRKTMEKYASDLAQLRSDKETLQKNKANLDAVQKDVAQKTSFLAGEVAKVDAYLATLSAKQQAFLAAKLESLGISRSAYNLKGGCHSDINPFKSPGFSPAFGLFSFGVPNRVGLNQFGAKGRAEAGQNAQTILSAYYNADYTSGYNQSINIHVVGTNEFGESINANWGIEDYLMHLYEMPTDFPMEALKAQAIAARSYALAYTRNGAGTICPSQQCQVVKLGAHDPDDAWSQAVRATAGIVLTNGGSPIKAWFSSTHGGYAFSSGDIGWSSTPWTKRVVDTTSGGAGSFSDLSNNAFDRSSPVFYCDWGSRADYNKTAWLKPDELADIVNVTLLAEKDGSTKEHLYQLDKGIPDTWSPGTVKTELSSRGITPFDSVSGVSIGVDFGSGRTTSVTISGDAPSQTINGDDFKNYFNLRAPSNIQVVGPLYNVEIR